MTSSEQQLTFEPCGHILTNVGCWSADGEWIVYDVRSDAAGSVFDGNRIERLHVATGRIEVLYESTEGACCGVVTACPVTDRVVFILGPNRPDLDWPYAAYHRRGVIVRPGKREYEPLDAMCYQAPYIAGALRGGSHVHTFDAQGNCVAYTYEDHVLATVNASESIRREKNQRNVGLSAPIRRVDVPSHHPRNHSGSYFSVLLTRTWDVPQPGSDQIDRAYEDAWIGQLGYYSVTKHMHQKSIAFLGDTWTLAGQKVTELFLVDLPEDITVADSQSGPLEGTDRLRPRPPLGTEQRRLTFTQDLQFPGVCTSPRHWPRSLPDGSRVFFLMRDKGGIPQIWSITPYGKELSQLTNVSGGVSSAFSVSGDGHWIAHVTDGCVCVTDTQTGQTKRLTHQRPPALAPRPEACVFSADSQSIAYVCPVESNKRVFNQVFVCKVH